MNNGIFCVLPWIFLLLFRTGLSSRFRALVIGGSGRVGGSGVRALCERFGDTIDLTVIGRSKKNWERSGNRLHSKGVSFIELYIDEDDNAHRLEDIIQSHDIVIHTAGPFQRIREPKILEYTLRHGKKYLDVCDDIELSRICRSLPYQNLARSTGGSAIISMGIWPGTSSLLAQELIHRVGGAEKIDKVVFSFFTAGSGGAGPTILTATFLLLGENVLTYKESEKVYKKSATDPRMVDFGLDFGEREVVRLNLIECESCAVSDGIRNVETFFGTAPPIWNSLFVIMANLIPQKVLQNKNLMEKLAYISLPMVRLVDRFVGSKNGIRVDVTDADGRTHTALLTHEDMEKSVGDAIAAFTHQMLLGAVPPGVYFPEEASSASQAAMGDSRSFRSSILDEVSKDAISYSYKIDHNVIYNYTNTKDEYYDMKLLGTIP